MVSLLLQPTFWLDPRQQLNGLDPGDLLVIGSPKTDPAQCLDVLGGLDGHKSAINPWEYQCYIWDISNFI